MLRLGLLPSLSPLSLETGYLPINTCNSLVWNTVTNSSIPLWTIYNSCGELYNQRVKNKMLKFLSEQIQIRAMDIISPQLSYTDALTHHNITTLYDRRTQMCKRFFVAMQYESHKLNYLLPSLLERRQLRSTLKYELPKCRTKRFKNSFVPYCLFNLQWCICDFYCVIVKYCI